MLDDYNQHAKAQGYSDEEIQELRKRQMELELAKQMQKMNQENSYNPPPPDHQYEDAYQDRKALHDYNAPQAKAHPSMAAGGKSLIKESEENKFTLSGYDDKAMMNQSKRSSGSVYETSSNAYGNSNIGQLSKLLL